MKRAPLARRTRSHRNAYAPDDYAQFRARLCAAWGWRCGCCGKARPLQVDPVIRRSQLGPDEGNCWPLCWECHARRDWPFERGRLLVENLEHGRKRWAIVTKADKWAPDPPKVAWTEVGPTEPEPGAA